MTESVANTCILKVWPY